MESRAELGQVARRPEEVRTPGERFEGVDRILFARTDRLGDLILSLPALAGIRRAYPEAHLGLLLDAAWSPLVPRIREVDEFLPIGGGAAERMAALASFKPQLIVCVSRGKELAWSARMSRIPHRLGSGRRFYSALFTRSVDETRRHGERHEAEYALSFAHRAGAPASAEEWPLGADPDADAELGRWEEERQVDLSRAIYLHPGSGGSCPRWPLRRWLELGRRLEAAGHPVLLGLGPREASWADKIDADPENRRLIRFDAPLALLASALERVRMAVGNSTGPIHMAAALGTPTVAIHAPWPSCGTERWGPYAANGWTVTAARDDALEWDRAERKRRAGEVMAGLPVDAVEAKLRQVLRATPPRAGTAAGGRRPEPPESA